jgi:hypothetical protein
MKKYFLIVFLFIFTFANELFSQGFAVDKGAIIASGSFSFSKQGGDLYEVGGKGNTIVSLTPSFNYMLFKNFGVGGSVSLSSIESYRTSMSELVFGPHIGIFFGNEKSTLFPYFTLSYRFISVSESPNSFDGSDIVLNLGMIIPLKNHIGLTIEGGYHFIELENSGDKISGNILMFGVGISGLFY